MFTQLEKEVGYVRREGFWAIPVEDSDSGTGVNNRIPKVNFGRREVKNGGDRSEERRVGKEC